MQETFGMHSIACPYSILLLEFYHITYKTLRIDTNVYYGQVSFSEAGGNPAWL